MFVFHTLHTCHVETQKLFFKLYCYLNFNRNTSAVSVKTEMAELLQYVQNIQQIHIRYDHQLTNPYLYRG